MFSQKEAMCVFRKRCALSHKKPFNKPFNFIISARKKKPLNFRKEKKPLFQKEALCFQKELCTLSQKETYNFKEPANRSHPIQGSF